MSYLKTLSVALIPCVTFTGGLYIGKYYSYNEASISLLGKEIPMESLELMVETIEDNFYTHDVPEAKDMEYSLIGGLVGALGDPHTSFFPPQELEDFEVAVNGEFFGIGAELS
ncbi:MAG: hypothetical protein U9Q15_05175, partial [Patescibacteria group bacterium]|nr:hypothetical protein [Patescibacteria group bacterium]